jgi:hypothetical protein
MVELDANRILVFLENLGAQCAEPQMLYLLGDGALILLGNSRATLDLDYVGDDLRPTVKK